MDQIKIGKFILELRKEKNMTQQELANVLGVTERAISKWENGRGLPDLSLLKPLCDTLNITINELLSGEKLNKAEYINKSEENIIKTINYTEKKLNRTKKTFKIIITALKIPAEMLMSSIFAKTEIMATPFLLCLSSPEVRLCPFRITFYAW